MIMGLCACGGGGGLFAKPTPPHRYEASTRHDFITTDDVALNAGYTVIEESGTGVTMLRRCFDEL